MRAPDTPTNLLLGDCVHQEEVAAPTPAHSTHQRAWMIGRVGAHPNPNFVRSTRLVARRNSSGKSKIQTYIPIPFQKATPHGSTYHVWLKYVMYHTERQRAKPDFPFAIPPPCYMKCNNTIPWSHACARTPAVQVLIIILVQVLVVVPG